MEETMTYPFEGVHKKFDTDLHNTFFGGKTEQSYVFVCIYCPKHDEPECNIHAIYNLLTHFDTIDCHLNEYVVIGVANVREDELVHSIKARLSIINQSYGIASVYITCHYSFNDLFLMTFQRAERDQKQLQAA